MLSILLYYQENIGGRLRRPRTRFAGSDWSIPEKLKSEKINSKGENFRVLRYTWNINQSYFTYYNINQDRFCFLISQGELSKKRTCPVSTKAFSNPPPLHAP